MTPAVIRAALATAITGMTGIAAASIFWARRPQGRHAPQYAVLRLRSPVAHGRDEVVYREPGGAPVGSELVPHQVGLRGFVWQIQIHSHDATDALDALAYCEAIRDRLLLPEYTDAFTAADIAVADVAALLEIDRDQDKREMSVAQIDVRMNATSDVAGTAIGYVTNWHVKAEADFQSGSPTATIMDGVVP